LFGFFFSEKPKLIQYSIDNYHNAQAEEVIISFRSSFLLRYLSIANTPLTPKERRENNKTLVPTNISLPGGG
jgi:hypothetical protein